MCGPALIWFGSNARPFGAGLYRDAQAGLDFLAQHPGLDATKLLVFGRSLGGAVALDLASRPEHACRLLGIVVENTFCSVPEVGRLLFGWLRWLPDFCFKSQVRPACPALLYSHQNCRLGKLVVFDVRRNGAPGRRAL